MRPSSVVAVVALAAAVLSAATVHASDSDAALDELKQGFALKEADRCREAITHFTRSHELDLTKPKPVLNLADCELRLGDLVAARGHFSQGRDLARAQNDAELIAAADERLAAVDRRLSRLVIKIASTAAQATIVTLDGTTLERSTLAAPVIINPGKHTVSVAAPGRSERRFDVDLAEGAVTTLDTSMPDVPARPYAPQPRREGSPGPWTTRTIVALGLGGVGVVGLAIGTAFGAAAIGKNSESNANGHCDATGCDGTGTDLRNTALSDATVSNVAFGSGLAALAGGAVLYLTGPSTASSSGSNVGLSPQLGRDGAGVTLRGAW